MLHIANDEQLGRASAVLDDLLRRELDAGGVAYLDALTDLVETYERHHEVWPDSPPSDVLAELMASNRMTQRQLAEATGISQSTISAILRGGRGMTVDHIAKLAGHFGVAPAVFLPRSEVSRSSLSLDLEPRIVALQRWASAPRSRLDSRQLPRQFGSGSLKLQGELAGVAASRVSSR